MKRCVCIMLLFIVITGCNAQVDPIIREEHAIYSTIINNYFKQGTTTVFLAKATSLDDVIFDVKANEVLSMIDKVVKVGTCEVSRDIIYDFQMKNRSQLELIIDLLPQGNRVKFVTNKYITRLKDYQFRSSYLEKYPKELFVTFSRVGFSQKTNEAIIYIQEHIFTNRIVFLSKKQDQWEILGQSSWNVR